jgi:hypothetical protein
MEEEGHSVEDGKVAKVVPPLRVGMAVVRPSATSAFEASKAQEAAHQHQLQVQDGHRDELQQQLQQQQQGILQQEAQDANHPDNQRDETANKEEEQKLGTLGVKAESGT